MKVLIMKSIFFAFILVFASSSSQAAEGSDDVEMSGGYHQRIGVVEAQRIRAREAISSRIAGGYSAYAGEHPYMAGLLVNLTTGQNSVCGGALVSSTRVVTAATCWNDGYSRGKRILVVLGSIYLYSGGTRVYATAVHTHQSFNPYTPVNNIAVLVIPYVSSTSNIKPLTLPYGSYTSNYFNDYTAEAVGYGGSLGGATAAPSLRGVYLDVMYYYSCSSYYPSAITSSAIICTKRSGYQGPCQGDMGAPLSIRFYNGTTEVKMLIGVASFGLVKGCLSTNPTIYTRVGYYSSWINGLL